MSDPTSTPPTPDAFPSAPPADENRPIEKPRHRGPSLQYKALALQNACSAFRESVQAALERNDQPGYHKAIGWLNEAERALRKAAVQVDEADTAALASLQAAKGVE